MAKATLIAKDKKDQTVTVYLNDKELGVLEERMEIDLLNAENSLYIKYGTKKSNIVKLNNTKEINVEVDSILKIERALMPLVPMFFAAFCFHKAAGLGYYAFAGLFLLYGVVMYLNRDNLMLKKGG